MTKRDEFIHQLEQEIAQEKKRTRLWSIVEVVGAVILVAGFILLGIKTKQFNKEVETKTAELAAVQVELDETKASLDDQNQQLQMNQKEFNSTMEQALRHIKDREFEEAEKLLGLELEPSKSELYVNSIYACNQRFAQCSTVKAGNVHAWARINSPGNNQVLIRWTYPDGTTRERSLNIGFNIDQGYRIFDTKILQPGTHKVEILSNGKVLPNGSKEFTVS